MDSVIDHHKPVILLGGGDVNHASLNTILTHTQKVVAVDGGANTAHSMGIDLAGIIGDFDSINSAALDHYPSRICTRIDEQDTTDFDKALRNVNSPLSIGYGFLGDRIDHQLAALNTLVKYPGRRCILVGAVEVLLLCPPSLHIEMVQGDRVSLFPLGAVEGHSEGLRWPINGLGFAPDGRIGTSNEAVGGPVLIEVTSAKMLISLPLDYLVPLMVQLLRSRAMWPAL